MGNLLFAGFSKTMKKISIVVYTASFGGYLKNISPAPDNDNGVDYICFTDDSTLVAPNWQLKLVHDNFENPIQANRYFKILPHKVLPNHDWSLYIDANIQLLKSPLSMVLKYECLRELIYIPEHYLRSCIYDEAAAIISLKKGDLREVLRQIRDYKKVGFPRAFGLTENGIMLRKHFNPEVIDLMEAWFSEFNKYYSQRDQLSLPFAIWRSGKKISYLKETARNENEYFKYHAHSAAKHNNLMLKFFFIISIYFRSICAKVIVKYL